MLLNYRTWLRRFSGDPAILGSSIMINGRTFTLVGVAPAEFTGTERLFTPEFWIPSMMREWIEGYSGLTSRGDGQWLAFGRLSPGVTLQQAQAQRNSVAQQLSREYPGPDDGMAPSVNPPFLVGPDLRNAVIAFSLALSLMVGLVLAITCTNLASLLLARGTHRHKRNCGALGHGSPSSSRRAAIANRQSSALGPSCGFGIASRCFAHPTRQSCGPFSRLYPHARFAHGLRVVSFAAALAVLTGIAFGLFPALYASRPDLLGTFHMI